MIIKRFNSFIQINRKFYIRIGEGFEEVEGEEITIEGFEKFDFFIHKIPKGRLELYQVSEAISGTKITKLHRTANKAIKQAESILNQKGESPTEFRIKERVGDMYLTPRYQFLVNPNRIKYSYVATKENNSKKSVLTRRIRVHISEE